jgi:hypothetical protein
MFDSPIMKLGSDFCLGKCSDEFDGSGERFGAILAILFIDLGGIQLQNLHISNQTAFVVEGLESMTSNPVTSLA